MDYFTNNWHNFNDIEPDQNSDVWFVIAGNIMVGVYDDGWFVMADGGSFEAAKVAQWRYVMEAPMRRFPEDGEIVAAELEDAKGLVTGIFFEDYYDEEKDEAVGPALALNDIYNIDSFKDANFEGAIEASNIINFLEVPDLPRP